MKKTFILEIEFERAPTDLVEERIICVCIERAIEDIPLTNDEIPYIRTANVRAALAEAEKE